jgi:hypothetical protein
MPRRVAAVLISFLSATASTVAQEAPANLTRPLFAKYCLDCHGAEADKKRLRLDTLPADFETRQTNRHWARVLDKLQSGEMPPPRRKSRPTAEERRQAEDWIQKRLAAADLTRQRAEGRVVLRRLNRTEYENTLHDLLGIDTKLASLLPEDSSVGGFDNNAGAMRLSAVHMERYLEAADLALDDAISSDRDPPPVRKQTFRYDFTNDSQAHWTLMKDGYAIFFMPGSISYPLRAFSAPRAGRYRVRIKAFAYQSDEPVTMRVAVGDIYQLNGAGAQGDATHHLVGYLEVPAGKPTVVEFVDSFHFGDTIRIDPYNMLRPTNYAEAKKYRHGKVEMSQYLGAGLGVGDIEIEGPLNEIWPPESHTRLFGKMPQVAVAGGKVKKKNGREPDRPRFVVSSTEPARDAERILRAFLPNAYRRPVTDAEVRPFVELVQAHLKDGYNFEEAVRVGLKAALCSPGFLYLSARPGPLDGCALASRLSYFLWNSMPDQELLDVAARGTLAKPEVLRQQVERMLRHPRSHRFTENFVGQWLDLRNIGFTMPDPDLFPDFDEFLHTSSVRETERFFEELLTNDLSLLNFVDSDFAVINERLAWHYRIPGVKGVELRKVKLPRESGRGGVLTQASVLKVTANGTTTSPVVRGVWVLRNILGQPPPPPPANVPAIEPDIRGAVTIREQLAKHRQIASCAACHAKIDPPGFALECFDPIGGRRDFYRLGYRSSPSAPVVRQTVNKDWDIAFRKGLPVDATGETAGGKRFRDIAEFKRILLEDKDQIARCLTEKLLVYATGGAIRPADREVVERIVSRIGRKNYGFRTLIHEVVQSPVFLNK